MKMRAEVESFTLAHLPIVKEYAYRMGLVEIVDRTLASSMHVSPGKILLGLVMNTLCGRSPLYRVEEFFRIRDTAALLGEDVTAEMLNDDSIGRVLDRVYEYGTWKIFLRDLRTGISGIQRGLLGGSPGHHLGQCVGRVQTCTRRPHPHHEGVQ